MIHSEDLLLAVLAARLSVNEVDALVDTSLRGLSLRSVAREYGVSSQLVSQRVCRARRKIMAAMRVPA